jgi:hypothetical protein
MCTRIVSAAIGVALILSALTAAANGNKAKKEVYDGKAGQIIFTVELEPIPFQITTVGNRYRLVRIRIVNEGPRPLALAAQSDKVVAYTRDGEVEGILDIGRRDAPLWDGFPLEVRTLLAYPMVVKAREEESVFVFFDATRLKSAPGGLLYTLAGLNDQVPLTRRGATTAH